LLIIVNANVNNIFTVAYLKIGALVTMTLIHFIVRPYSNEILNSVDGFLLLTTIMVVMLQPFQASSGFATNTVIGLSFFLVLFPLFVYIVFIIPYMNKNNIKNILMSVFSSSKREATSTQMQPKLYQVTIDDELRKSTATTIV